MKLLKTIKGGTAMNEAALKEPTERATPPRIDYDEELHGKFLAWLSHTGRTQAYVAKNINRSAAAVNQYVQKKFQGNLSQFEKDIFSFLDRDKVEYPLFNPSFVFTSTSTRIWSVLQACCQDKGMGLVVGPAGCGKSETLKEFKRQMRGGAILAIADVTTRSLGSVLSLLGRKVGVGTRGANSLYLERITETLRGSSRILIIDEAHFLGWEAFEACRKIYDCAGIGVVFAGQERLYEEMRGGHRSFLWDQIYSRVGARCHINQVEKADIELLASKISPGLDKKCISFLLQKASGLGRFRTAVMLLQRARRISEADNIPITLDLLKDANSLLL
jgi:hypothetical protein